MYNPETSDLCPHGEEYWDCIPCNATAQGISEEEMAREMGAETERWEKYYSDFYEEEQADV
jgi:hypothetical protein